MSKTLVGITHAIVRTVKSQQDMDAMKGIMAFVDICFGPGDDNAIKAIAIRKVSGPTMQVSGEVQKTLTLEGLQKKWSPVLCGAIASEAIMLGLVAFDRVKASKGLKFNKTYKVIAKEVQEIGETNEIVTSSAVTSSSSI